MAEIELLKIEPNLREEDLNDRIQFHAAALTFNGRSVAEVTMDVIAIAQRELTASLGQFSDVFKFDNVSVATYHFEEQAIYLAINFRSSVATFSSASGQLKVGAVVRAGASSGQVLIEPVSAQTCELIFELMDCIDLTPVIL